MNIDCFMKRYVTILLTDQNDGIFESFKILIGGTTSVRIAKLLNFAVSQMDKDECYVETGVYTGCTLISSHWANDRLCIGIDPYKDMKEATVVDAVIIRDMARRNIQGMAAGCILLEKDFRDVDDLPKKVAVSFIDAKHDYQNVLDNLIWLDPFLANDALIFFDDINYSEVARAISEWQMNHSKDYELITYIKPAYGDQQNMSSVTERYLNNGFAIVRYHKEGDREAKKQEDGVRLEVESPHTLEG